MYNGTPQHIFIKSHVIELNSVTKDIMLRLEDFLSTGTLSLATTTGNEFGFLTSKIYLGTQFDEIEYIKK